LGQVLVVWPSGGVLKVRCDADVWRVKASRALAWHSERLQGASKLDLTVTVTPYARHTTHRCNRRHGRYNRHTLCAAEAAGDSEWRRKAALGRVTCQLVTTPLSKGGEEFFVSSRHSRAEKAEQEETMWLVLLELYTIPSGRVLGCCRAFRKCQSATRQVPRAIRGRQGTSRLVHGCG
jgi:hypothetical protein